MSIPADNGGNNLKPDNTIPTAGKDMVVFRRM